MTDTKVKKCWWIFHHDWTQWEDNGFIDTTNPWTEKGKVNSRSLLQLRLCKKCSKKEARREEL